MKPIDAVRLCPPDNINESITASSDSEAEHTTHAYTQIDKKVAPPHHLHIDEDCVEAVVTTPPPTTTTSSHPTFGGLSHNLSSESIKQACDYYDDELSDDDLIEVHTTPECFQKRLAAAAAKGQSQRSLRKKAVLRHSNKCESEANPLYLCREEEDEEEDDLKERGKCLFLAEKVQEDEEEEEAAENNDDDDDDALNVLNELDAILDIHSEMPSSTRTTDDVNDEDTKIEDCLLDLDNYLEEMDASCPTTLFDDDTMKRGEAKERESTRTRTLPSKATRAGEVVGGGLVRGHALRKTASYIMHDRGRDDNPGEEPHDWRRSSMRELALMQKSNAWCGSRDLDEPTNSMQSTSEDLRRSLSHDNLTPPEHAYSSFPSTSSAASGNRILTDENIFRNILTQSESSQSGLVERPRQFGRRAEGHPCVLSIRSAEEQSGGCTIIGHEQRPMSAPVHRSSISGVAAPHPNDFVSGNTEHSALFVGSEGSSLRSYQNQSPVSIISSTDSTSTAASTNGNMAITNLVGPDGGASHTQRLDAENVANSSSSPAPASSNEWPHSFGRTLALLCCTLGLFNMCRFAVLTINYGGNFLLQFLLLSVLFGIPMFWLQMCLGAKIKAGPVSMWKISPICKGIGISLILVQFIVAIYSTVAVAWILVYIRDSIPSKASYRWQETIYSNRLATSSNGNFTDHIADYFNMYVLQRLQFGKDFRFHVSDRLAFNLALLWSLVFLVLCKGFKSYGKVVFILVLLPLIGLIAVTAKIVYITDPSKLQNIFSSVDLDDFLINSKTWAAAAQEVFLTWILLGASVISVTSRTAANSNAKTSLRRDAIFVVLVTMLGLTLAALLGLCCVEILKQNSYIYVPGSFETPESYISIYSLKSAGTSDLLSYPSKWMPHYSSFVGETYKRPRQTASHESGYQALRFICEVLPAALTLSSASMSWVWTMVAFIVFAMLGFAQLCVMWKPISSALGNSTSSVLLSCVTGLMLSIPFATDMGIAIMHYMDLIMGGAWFIPVLWAAQIFGVFLIRGRPYNGDDLVNDLKMSMSLSAFLALSWNVMLPIGLITLSVVEYKISHANQFYYWREKSYFPYWARKVAGLTQVSFLILVPIVAIIQIYRYLSSGPPDILDRIEMLYRPSENAVQRRRGFVGSSTGESSAGRTRGGSNAANRNGDDDVRSLNDDAPPKYTPPPSYTTATGARLAKLLRQSIRRSVRRTLRILGDSSRPRANIEIDNELTQESLPPDYTSVSTITNITHSIAESCNDPEDRIQMNTQPRNANAYANRSLSLGRKVFTHKNRRSDDTNTRPASASCATFHRNGNTQSSYTADDVVTILRSTRSNRRGGDVATSTMPADTSSEMHVIQPQRNYTFRSIENLVLNAEPVGQSATVEETCESDEEDQQQQQDNGQNGNNNNNTSVI